MDNYRIKGGNVLSGTIKVSGAKNAALPIIAASVMTRGESVLSSCPEISDVDSMLKILKALGCRIDKTG
ncbi:MAG: UDP-N-acetylglucosamine 1-carboxyvinyltransferase, partial [Firmicutes bacterium]|nr:UDP-N-acetylglucosamine 1-carboxyvinyltransferase [Bacillota bacterium]